MTPRNPSPPEQEQAARVEWQAERELDGSWTIWRGTEEEYDEILCSGVSGESAERIVAAMNGKPASTEDGER